MIEVQAPINLHEQPQLPIKNAHQVPQWQHRAKISQKMAINHGLWAHQPESADQQFLLPLQSVAVRGWLEGPLATIEIDMTYINEDEQSAIECSYEFPCDKSVVMGHLSAQIGGKEVTAKIKEKEAAREQYQDAMAGGNTAVFAEKKTQKEESMKIVLGGLPPKEEAKLSIQLIYQIGVENSSFFFKLPEDFYPNYSKMGAPDSQKYAFDAEFKIKSTKPITQVSAPEGSICERDQQGTEVIVRCSEPGEEFKIYYRSSEMRHPHLLYAEDPEYPGEVAVSASFVPTFEPLQSQEEFEVMEEVEPDATTLSQGKDYVFIFIVDRSGSMSGARMETCKEALKLFLRSLPVGSKFAIISFGSNFSFMQINGKQIIDYNNQTSVEAIRQISSFSANFGMTEILRPFKAAQQQMQNMNKRIFLLTDGQVGNSYAVIEQAKFQNDTIRTHTFGIGSGCDEHMVVETAKAGRGSFSLVKDNNSKELNAKVINALAHAFEPSLKNCELTFGGKTEKLNEVFRHAKIFRSAIMSKQQFENIKFAFSSEQDPVTKQPINLECNVNSFKKVKEGGLSKAIFKNAALSSMQDGVSSAERIKMSVKYQVLTDETAMIGVVKQKDKSTGEMKTFEKALEKVRRPAPVQQAPKYQEPIYCGSFSKALASNNAQLRKRQSNMDMMRAQVAQRNSCMQSPKRQRRGAIYSDDSDESMDDSSLNSSSDEGCYRVSRGAPPVVLEQALDDFEFDDCSLGASFKKAKKAKKASPAKKRGANVMKSKSRFETDQKLSCLSERSSDLDGCSATFKNQEQTKRNPTLVEALAQKMGSIFKKKSSVAKFDCISEQATKQESQPQMLMQEPELLDIQPTFTAQLEKASKPMLKQQQLFMDEEGMFDCKAVAAPQMALATPQMAMAAPQSNMLSLSFDEPEIEQVINTGPKPTFETLISLQASDGNWVKNSESSLVNFFSDGNIEDSTIQGLLTEAKSKGSSTDMRVIHLTIVALYILKEEFPERKDEWQLLMKKAKEFLKQVGVENIDKYLKKLKLKLKA